MRCDDRTKLCSQVSKEKGKKVEASADNESDGDDTGDFVLHPQFPEMPASVPLTYTLAMHACLSAAPEERPTFEQVSHCPEPFPHLHLLDYELMLLLCMCIRLELHSYAYL